MITRNQLSRIMPGATESNIDLYLGPLNAAMAEFDITTPLRKAAFLAQITHESGQLRWMAELWGPTGAQLRYDPPNRKAKELGNIHKGDGRRYKGRGPIQITGRGNYRKYGALLGIDLEANPDKAANADVGFRIAGAFWKTHGLNELADKCMITAITKAINGGTNGIKERLAFYRVAKKVLLTE
jgi:predicted chitinase